MYNNECSVKWMMFLFLKMATSFDRSWRNLTLFGRPFSCYHSVISHRGKVFGCQNVNQHRSGIHLERFSGHSVTEVCSVFRVEGKPHATIADGNTGKFFLLAITTSNFNLGLFFGMQTFNMSARPNIGGFERTTNNNSY